MRKLLQPGQGVQQRSLGPWLLALFGVLLLLGMSTLQACHVHDSAALRRDGLPQITAPADECPLCAVPHVAVAAQSQTTAAALPQTEFLFVAALAEAQGEVWNFVLFGRPPPAARSEQRS